jgi:hypothetical protein
MGKKVVLNMCKVGPKSLVKLSRDKKKGSRNVFWGKEKSGFSPRTLGTFSSGKYLGNKEALKF